MSSFDDRQKSYESKFAHDAELAFRAEARRNRRLGLWAADLLGQSGPEASQYAEALLATALGENGGGRVFERVSADLQGHADPQMIRTKMEALLAEAWQELRGA
ncbi:MAG: DUF1476 domain-containing protein [Pararhodobacter sp.]|nr:DUF1476 domain-containing protein [Pararhodobacter sp.]